MDYAENINPFYLEASTNIIRYCNFLEPDLEPIVKDQKLLLLQKNQRNKKRITVSTVMSRNHFLSTTTEYSKKMKEFYLAKDNAPIDTKKKKNLVKG